LQRPDIFDVAAVGAVSEEGGVASEIGDAVGDPRLPTHVTPRAGDVVGERDGDSDVVVEVTEVIGVSAPF
jgi:hypothetical protein